MTRPESGVALELFESFCHIFFLGLSLLPGFLLAAGNIIEPVAKAEVGSEKGLSGNGGFLAGNPDTETLGVENIMSPGQQGIITHKMLCPLVI